MARFILWTLLLVCLFCLLQASPMPQQTQPEAAETVEDKLKNAWNDVKNSLNQDKINEFVENGKEWLNKAVDTVRKEAEKIIPKTN